MTEILRVLTEADWAAAEATGFIEPNALDRRDGFLHLSSPATVLGVIERYFGAHPRVYVVSFAASPFSEDLRWAQVYPDQPPYPHVYRPRLALSDLQRVRCVIQTPEGLRWAPTPGSSSE